MEYLLICGVALAASGLTFFTGFGLGTLLLPAFAVFFPVPVAVALTAVVHLLNSLFKIALVGRRADPRVALRFGLPAVVAAYAGASVLLWLSDLRPVATYEIAGRLMLVTPVNLAVAVLMAVFSLMEMFPRSKGTSIPPRYLPVGGLLAGFFGGLSGHQGALRSAFLIRSGMSKEAFIGTGALIAAGVDLTRLAVYADRMLAVDLHRDFALLAAATASAFLGALIGNRLLQRVALRSIEIAVAILLMVVAVGLAAGVL